MILNNSVAGLNMKVAVTSSLKDTNELFGKVKSYGAEFRFIEIMRCPCRYENSDVQPLVSAHVRNFTEVGVLRAKALYDTDKKSVNHMKIHQ